MAGRQGKHLKAGKDHPRRKKATSNYKRVVVTNMGEEALARARLMIEGEKDPERLKSQVNVTGKSFFDHLPPADKKELKKIIIDNNYELMHVRDSIRKRWGVTCEDRWIRTRILDVKATQVGKQLQKDSVKFAKTRLGSKDVTPTQLMLASNDVIRMQMGNIIGKLIAESEAEGQAIAELTAGQQRMVKSLKDMLEMSIKMHVYETQVLGEANKESTEDITGKVQKIEQDWKKLDKFGS